MNQPYYDSDLTDEEWDWIEPLLPPEKPLGKRRAVNLRVSMASSTELTMVLNGEHYPLNSGLGKPSMDTFDYGCGWEFGSKAN